MDDIVMNQLKNLYEINYDIPHRVFQFPRIPPGINPPMFKIFENPVKDKFIQNSSNLNKKLDSFQRLYQQHVSGLMTTNSLGIIPPGHPLHSEKNSVQILKTENDQLLKQNLELKKRLEQKENSSK